MATNEELYQHTRNFHRVEQIDLISLMNKHNGDITAAHDELHTGTIEPFHQHEANGDVTSDSRLYTNGEQITTSLHGWQVTAASLSSALDKMSDAIQNHEIRVGLDSRVEVAGTFKGTLLFGIDASFSNEGVDYLTLVKLIVGSIYYELEQRLFLIPA